MHKGLKEIFLEEVVKISDGAGPVAIALSSGIDSTAVGLALSSLGKAVHAYTFYVEGVKSQDLVYARKTAETFAWEFTPCEIPREVDKSLVLRLIRDLGLSKKTDIECSYPFFFLIPRVEERVLITGSCADGHFCISKKGMIHYRGSVEKTDEYRRSLFGNNNYAQTKTLAELGALRGISIDTPYNKPTIIEYFLGKSWAEVNKPKQKQPILDLFPESFAAIKTFPHTNLQCGDSQIRELFEPLLRDEELNRYGRKRVLDLYRDLSREVLI